MRKWIKRIVLSLLVIIAGGSIAVFLWLRSSRPVYSGQIQLKGLHHPVDINYDDHGVPHIYASDNHDLYMAFGYVHAQDRLFQMEMLRRAGSGTLAEIIGRPLLKVDRMFRTLGLMEYAKESAAYMESQKGTAMYNDIQAYREGINYFVEHGDTPPEFSVIGIEKRPFTLEDLYYTTGAMSFSFSQAQKTEPVIDFIATHYGDRHLHDIALWHDSTESFIPTTNDVIPVPLQKNSLQREKMESEQEGEGGTGALRDDALLEFASAMKELEQLLPFAPLEGSNSWVVGPTKTRHNQVLFCNDTHIGYMLPQTWYEAHLNSPGFEVYGHFMAGVPFALIGRNREMSWGVTMLLNDDMDFYKEDFTDETHYVFKGETKEAKLVPHTIRIKGEPDTTIMVRVTNHGPVINDIFDGNKEAGPLSMFWTYTRLPNRTVDAFHGLNHATTMQQFEQHLPLIHAPGLSINYGDAAGNIAWWGCASLIERPLHVNSFITLEGSSGEDDPLGYYPFEENPRCINPERGYIYSANDWPQELIVQTSDTTASQNDVASVPIWYPGYYKPQYRADRIRKLIESSDKWDLTSIQQVMTDTRNEADSVLMRAWYRDLASMEAVTGNNELRRYLELFDWSGEYDPGMAQPTFFNKMLYHYLHMTMVDELGEERFDLFMHTHQVQRTQNFLYAQEKSPWWDIQGTPQTETRDDIILSAFTASVRDLREQFGDNPKIWSWRKACSLELRHPLGEVALFRPLFNIGPHAVVGGNETILQSGFIVDSTGQYKVYYGSQMRIIVDFATVDSSLNVTPSGQSGHVMSSHYADQAALYRDKKFRPVYLDRDRISRFEKLELVP